MRKIILIAILIITTAFNSSAQEIHSITIEFHGMKSDKGFIYVALYDNETDFLKKFIKSTIVEIKDKKATAALEDIPPGEYAISAFHDKNENGKLDVNFFGIPKEPTGTSNNIRGFMGPPKYKKAKFELKEDRTLKIQIK
ncbi:MAG: DUF2141 domain-containing protein [Flavobacteriaceae bacterium]|nr:MAG: DUF2141 domain-containing protein [Flavobacteriaceae bacterium]